jgi:hypothetical protein
LGGATSEKTIALKITWNSGDYRRAYSYDTSASSAPTLYVEYEEEAETTVSSPKGIYGYFNPEYFYTYNSTYGRFEHAYKKVSYSNVVWTALKLSDGTTTTLDNSSVQSGGLWDGNWMNWLCNEEDRCIEKGPYRGKGLQDTDNAIIVSGENPAQTYQILSKEFYRRWHWCKPLSNKHLFWRKGRLSVLNTIQSNSCTSNRH